MAYEEHEVYTCTLYACLAVHVNVFRHMHTYSCVPVLPVLIEVDVAVNNLAAIVAIIVLIAVIASRF